MTCRLVALCLDANDPLRLARFCFFGSESMDTLYLLQKASTKPDLC